MDLTEKKTRMPVEITKKNHRRLKVLAAMLDRSMTSLINEGVLYIIEKLEKEKDGR